MEMNHISMMEEKKKLPRFRIVLFAWDKSGNSVGHKINFSKVEDIEQAIETAREMYKMNFVGMEKQLTIFDDAGIRYWRYYKNKVSTFKDVDN